VILIVELNRQNNALNSNTIQTHKNLSLWILFQNCSIFTFRHSVLPWTMVTSHLISTLRPLRPHKSNIFW
jgi:hypothetical protein